VNRSRDLPLLIRDLLSLADNRIAERLKNFIGYIRGILSEEELIELLENLTKDMSHKVERLPSLGFVPPPWTDKDIMEIRKAIKKAAEFLEKEKRKKVEEAIYTYI
jgi:hypothetical protein